MSNILNEKDSKTVNSIIKVLSRIQEESEKIGVSKTEDGNITNYLEETEEGRKLLLILSNLNKNFDYAKDAVKRTANIE